MSVLTQGTHIFFLDPEGAGTVVQVKRATQFNPGGNPAGQIDETALEDLDAQFRRGFRTPGAASMTINADPAEPSHIRLHELSESNDQTQEKLKWVVGWSDGTEPPTVAGGEFVLPTTRTWFKFTGYVADFPFDFALNTIVTTQISIQRSGGSQWVKKAPPAP